MKISVAVCTYNGEPYIREQLESILAQSRSVDEIVVGDDGSSDKTIEIVTNVLQKSDVSYRILQNKKLGVAQNFATTIQACDGDIVFTSDQDDVWMPNKVKRIEEQFCDPEVALVFTNALLVNHKLESLSRKLWEVYPFDQAQVETSFLDILLKYNVVTGATMAFRREQFLQMLPIPSGCLHDEWIAIRSVQFGKAIALDEMLIQYRQHGGNVVGAKKESFFQKTEKYLNNFQKVTEIKKNKYEFYNNAWNALKKNVSVEKREKLQRCVKYWRESLELQEKGLVSGTKWIISSLKCYQKYYTGIRGAFRDWVVLLKG
ncbi:MAG: glycosyltransferase family 2 protein [Eubacteriales bacterium]|nr:glycosyltransferase family 2 protein [Eubacteriales bacterium]